MTPKLLIATRSKGKFPEIMEKLNGLPFEFLNPNDTSVPKGYEVDEVGKTFEGNALIKAMTLAHMTGHITLADDSGLEIDVLGGKPGVYSARYTPGSDEDRYRKVLAEMKDIPDGERTARYRAVIAVYDPATHRVALSYGSTEGIILTEPHGTGGFGYDPVFFNTPFGKTFAEMTLEEKSSISHRGRALTDMYTILTEW